MQDEYDDTRASERLREIIRARGETMAGFARVLDIPYRSVQDYVSGKSKPGFEQLKKFAMAGIDIGYLLTGKPTLNQIYNLNSHLATSRFLAADDEIIDLIVDKIPSIVDRAVAEFEQVTDITYLGAKSVGSVSWPIVSLWENTAIIAANVSDEMAEDLSRLREQGVSLLTIVEAIMEATAIQVIKKVRAKEIP